MSKRRSRKRANERAHEELPATEPARPRYLFLMDEMMPASASRELERLGHEVRVVGQTVPRLGNRGLIPIELPFQTPDRHIADRAEEIKATLVTYNKKHFDKLVGPRSKKRHVGAIYLQVPETQCMKRIRDVIRLIEFEHRHADEGKCRVLITIAERRVILHR